MADDDAKSTVVPAKVAKLEKLAKKLARHRRVATSGGAAGCAARPRQGSQDDRRAGRFPPTRVGA
jgi:hypothetical protein